MRVTRERLLFAGLQMPDRLQQAPARSSYKGAAMPADFSEVNHLAADLAKAAPRTVALAQKVIVKTAHDIEGTAKQMVPVDTGATKSSIGVDVGVLQATIGPTTSYAYFLEYGTSRMAPYAFMGPALDRHNPAFYAAMEQVAGGLL
jgi:HK97 gp10 family phage protein